MPTLRTPHGDIHWLEAGNASHASVVVLLHGLGGDAGFWRAEQAALAEHFRVLAIDLRGSGLSSATDQAFSIEDLAQDVSAVLQHLGIASAHVVGFSMGGLVAQALAVLAPERIRSLVLAASFARTNVQARGFLEAVASVYRSGSTAKQMFQLVLPWLFSERFLAHPDAAPWLHYPDDAPDEQAREDWLRLLDAQLAFDGRARLGEIRARTLVVCGAEDRLAPPSDARNLANGIAGSVLVELAGGHLMNVEDGDAFMAQLQEFIAAD